MIFDESERTNFQSSKTLTVTNYILFEAFTLQYDNKHKAKKEASSMHPTITGSVALPMKSN
jgi:hypothetical protein